MEGWGIGGGDGRGSNGTVGGTGRGEEAETLLGQTTKTLHLVLGTGKEGKLAEISSGMAKSLQDLFDGFADEVESTVHDRGENGMVEAKKMGFVRMELKNWVRHIITRAATDAVYGPENPFRDEVVEKGFW